MNELRFDVKDIDVVINTHLHFNHTANNILFKHAKIYASPNECLEKCKDYLLFYDRYAKFTFNPVKEFEDDEIDILNTPGHTWGSISIIYRDYIVVGDTIPFKDDAIRGEIEKCVDRRYAKSSIKRIKALKKNIVTGHDGIIYADELS